MKTVSIISDKRIDDDLTATLLRESKGDGRHRYVIELEILDEPKRETLGIYFDMDEAFTAFEKMEGVEV